jgi:hypothetical protein
MADPVSSRHSISQNADRAAEPDSNSYPLPLPPQPSNGDEALQLSFCELLFTPALAYYFKSVHATNMNGFSSGITPAPGVWEVFVYQSGLDPRRNAVAGTRVLRDKFIQAVEYLGKHLSALDSQRLDAADALGGGLRGGAFISEQNVLEHIRTKDLNAEESALFGLFFDIVDNNTLNRYNKRTAVSIDTYKKAPDALRYKYHLSVKTFERIDVENAYARNIRSQTGGTVPTNRLALVTTFLPLVGKDVSIGGLDEYLKSIIKQRRSQEEAYYVQNSAVSGTEVGGGRHLRGGARDEEVREAFLRIMMEMQFENPTSGVTEVKQVVTHEEIAQYIACVGVKPLVPLSNTLTLASLPTNTWRKLSDGSYEKLTSEGYKPLPRDECEKILSGSCAGSNIANPGICEAFMKAVNDQNVDELVRMLTAENAFIWDSNTAADSMDKLHPETVLRILKAFGFGTKNGPYGKRVCTVDEWLSECVKNGSFKGSDVTSTSLKPNMRSYLEHLVAFVNSNPSLVDPSKRHFAALSSATTPVELQTRGVYYAGDELSKSGSSQLSFHDVQRAVHLHQSGTNLASILMHPTTAFGAVVAQNGGGQQLYTQATQAHLSLGSGISQLVEQSLNGLQATSHRIRDADVAQIREKVKKLTTLEQDIYQGIIQLNELRLAADSGINCHSQLSSAQDRLMQLGSMYDRRAPCLQELCEQLRMLLAQQNKSGCEPIA